MPGLNELIELIKVIDKTKDNVQLECNHDGAKGEWKWKLFQPNVRAGDYIARKERIDLEKGSV